MSERVFNWSGTRSCTPLRIARPRTEEEVVELMREARRRGQRVKAIGARHSWSDIAMSDGVLVSLDDMQGLLELDEQAGLARVEAGIRLHQLNEALAARGYGLSIVGSVVEQSLAGVMSTGTHGSSLVHGNIPSFVVGLRLVTGAGELLELDASDPRFAGARIGLGALGIITQVTIAVEPRFWLRETTQVLPFEQALAQLDTLARSAEYIKLWWLPHTDAVVAFSYARSPEPGRVPPLLRWLDERVVNDALFPLILALGKRRPQRIPALNRLVGRSYLQRRPRTDRADRILSLAMPPPHRETEYALPLARGAEAFAQLRARIDALGVRVNFIQELRFVKGDDAWMSPTGGQDSVQLGAYMADAAGIDAFLSGFEDDMQALGGRPHWGKEFRTTPAQLRRMYPKTEAFAALARELDPDAVLDNPCLSRLGIY